MRANDAHGEQGCPTVSNTKVNSLPLYDNFVSIKMGGKPFPVLMDSGANINLANYNILANEPELVKVSQVETDPMVYENKHVLLPNNKKLSVWKNNSPCPHWFP